MAADDDKMMAAMTMVKWMITMTSDDLMMMRAMNMPGRDRVDDNDDDDDDGDYDDDFYAWRL
eukprot:1423196-Pyramimonas_sp.AAC.1